MTKSTVLTGSSYDDSQEHHFHYGLLHDLDAEAGPVSPEC